MTKKTQKAKKDQNSQSILILLIILAAGVLTTGILLMQNKNVKTFAQCVEKNGQVLDTYPEQCKIGNKTFVNSEQKADYIGLSEQDALDKARSENKVARVVEREGESLAVTMDFMVGRLNLFIKNGAVYKVDIEGYANDKPINN